MRKISHGFIAIAILTGPASVSLAHQKLTETWPRPASGPVDVTTLVQQAYSHARKHRRLADRLNAMTTSGFSTDAQPV